MDRTFLSLMIAIAVMLFSCSEDIDPEKIRSELYQADSAFSAASQQKGMHEAFLSFADTEAVMLRPNNPPLKGRHQVEAWFNLRPDTGFMLTWKPALAVVSEAGDIGYTYGIYEQLARDESSKWVTVNGTYITVWRKRDGKWRWVLVSGNAGVGGGKVSR